MSDDPVVEEVREVRRTIWEECGEDWSRYFDRLRQGEATHPERLVARSKGAIEPATASRPTANRS